jgi:hypothetical protein
MALSIASFAGGSPSHSIRLPPRNLFHHGSEHGAGGKFSPEIYRRGFYGK